jgi:hypothetical protein
MAVFLALPTCPCQLFEPLGIEFPHRHEAGSECAGNIDYNGDIELTSPAGQGDDDLPICHCDESLGKLAEECGEDELCAPAKISGVSAWYESGFLQGGCLACSSARGPPPKLLFCFVLDRTLTGVYRL